MTTLADGNPIYWFRPISSLPELITEEPDAIEWLKIDSGECFIHTFGTAFWRFGGFILADLGRNGITHWRVKESGYSDRVMLEEAELCPGKGVWRRR